jgi:hypothetical protein
MKMQLRPCASVAVRKADEPAPGWHFTLGMGGGRAGVRNRLAAKVFEHIYAHWCEPAVPGATHCKGEAALELFYRQKPGDYLRLVAIVLPREFVFESAIAELDDEGLDEMLLALRAHRMSTYVRPRPRLFRILGSSNVKVLVSSQPYKDLYQADFNAGPERIRDIARRYAGADCRRVPHLDLSRYFIQRLKQVSQDLVARWKGRIDVRISI